MSADGTHRHARASGRAWSRATCSTTWTWRYGTDAVTVTLFQGSDPTAKDVACIDIAMLKQIDDPRSTSRWPAARSWTASQA